MIEILREFANNSYMLLIRNMCKIPNGNAYDAVCVRVDGDCICEDWPEAKVAAHQKIWGKL